MYKALRLDLAMMICHQCPPGAERRARLALLARLIERDSRSGYKVKGRRTPAEALVPPRERLAHPGRGFFIQRFTKLISRTLWRRHQTRARTCATVRSSLAQSAEAFRGELAANPQLHRRLSSKSQSAAARYYTITINHLRCLSRINTRIRRLEFHC